MVSQADRELINNFVLELRPYLDTVEVGVQEFAQPNRDGVVVGQAVQALMMIRGAGQILMVDGLVSISSWLVESFEKIQNNPDIAPAEAIRRLTGLYSAMDDYLTGLERGDNVDGVVLRAKTIFEAIPSFGGPLPGTGKLRRRTDLDALFGDDEHAAQTKRMTDPTTDTEKLAASASASPSDQTAEMPAAMPTVPLQRAEDVTQPVSEAITQPTREAPARIVPIPPQPTEELPKVDPELREIFEEEALEIIAAFGDGIRELARNPGDRESIRSLNRAAHTLKGAANMTGFPLIAQIGAAIELLFDEQLERDQPVGRDVLELVAVSWKMLRAMVPNLNDLTSFTSPSNSIVQRANVLREQLAQAHADAETIPMDEAHYGPRTPTTRVSEQTDEIVSLDVPPTAPQDELREVDAMMVEAAPTVPLRRDPVAPKPDVRAPEPAAEVDTGAAAPTDEIADPLAVRPDEAVSVDADFEITMDPAADTPFWGESDPEPAQEIDEDRPQSEPFWTPGTEELMRSSVGTDMLIADIQGLDDLEQEVAEAEAEAAEAEGFFTSVDGETPGAHESTPLDDGRWLDEPESPGTDLLDFDDTPQTEPFWDTLTPSQSEPLEAPEVEEEITMDPFFDSVDPDTSFLHPISTEAEAEPGAEELADAAEFEAAFVAGVEPFDPEQLDDFDAAPELPDDFFEEVAEEIAAADGAYTYSYAFDFADGAAADALPVEEPIETALEEAAAELEPSNDEPLEAAPSEPIAEEDEAVEAETLEADELVATEPVAVELIEIEPAVDEQVVVDDAELEAEPDGADEVIDVEPTAPADEGEDVVVESIETVDEDEVVEVEPALPDDEDARYETGAAETADDGDAAVTPTESAAADELDRLTPAFDGAVAELTASASVATDSVIPEPFVTTAEPLDIDVAPAVEPFEVDPSAWRDAEAVIPAYAFAPVELAGAEALSAFLIETEAPAPVAPEPVEEIDEIDSEAFPSDEALEEAAPEDTDDDVVEADEDIVAEPDDTVEDVEHAEDVVIETDVEEPEGDAAETAADDAIGVDVAEAPDTGSEAAEDTSTAGEDVQIDTDEAVTPDEMLATEEDVVVETAETSEFDDAFEADATGAEPEEAEDIVIETTAGPADEAGEDHGDIATENDLESVETEDEVEESAIAVEERAPGDVEEVVEEAPAAVDANEDVVETTGEQDAFDAPAPEDIVLDEAEPVDADEADERAEADEDFDDAGDDEAFEDIVEEDLLVAEPGDSALTAFDDVVASMEGADALGHLDWFEEPEPLEEAEVAPPVIDLDELDPARDEYEPDMPATGMLTETGTGALGTSSLRRPGTDTLGFGSLNLDRFLTTEGSIALSSALLDMAFTAQPGADGLDDGLDAPSISVFDESSDRALEIEMFETFALEAEDHVATLNRAAMQLDRDPLANEPLIDIKRSLHTLKGAAAAADFMEISDLAHELEDSLATHERLGSLADRTFTAELFSGTEDVEARLARRKDELFGVSEEEQSGGTLRIDVERVDGLLNTVGELVVNRSSFEERLERLEATIEDLSTAAARLQRSSYLLEREASAEDAIGRLLRGELTSLDAGMAISDVQTDWDMLEMDRYTEFDRLIRQLAEVGADVSTAVGEIGALRGDFDTISTRQRRLTTVLQDELMGIRMVPISSLAPRLYRVVRRAASRRGKEVSLIIEGGETPFDKLLLDTLSESLLHLLRNSVDHGIEDINERRRLGKPENGSIRIRAFRDGSEAVIEIIDDGAGIDHKALINHARARGLAVPDDITREAALLLIFEPGFSTKDEADDISGRGLGLEIVEQTVSRYKGRVAVDSVVGRGTIFSLRLPVMLSVIQAFLVSAGEGEFAIPVANVDYVVDRIDQPLTQIGESVVVETANQIIPVVDVSARIGRSQTPVLEKTSGWIMVTEIAGKRWALVVDELRGQQEIVVKPMGRFLRATPGLMGATILGHGDIALIVDVPALLGVDSLVTRLDSVSPTTVAPRSDAPKTPAAVPVEENPAHVVLVVDDSLSVRRVVSRTIERHGWVALLARDGVEALEMLEQGRADMLLTDIEMPRMDGFELISAVRSRGDYQDLPIVVLTSRSGEKHRERALGLGANEYLVKPFQEQELIEVIENMSRVSSEV